MGNRTLVFLLLGWTVSVGERDGRTDTTYTDVTTHRQDVLEQLFTGYDGSIPPTFHLEKPVVTTLQVYITSIDSISETNMDFEMGMFLRQSWNDSRLVFSHISSMKRLELDTRLMADVWVPDLYLPSEKRASVHDVTVPNKMMHIYPNGHILYSQRVTATLKCNLDLRKFPMDSQKCRVDMESYGYTTSTLLFRWDALPVDLKNDMRIAQFQLGQIRTLNCDKIYLEVGYTCVGFTFELHRSMGYYLTQVYIPSVLIVILSWVSFWLDVNAVPARISLGLLTVLTMTTQSSGARASLPKVSYVKAIDVWMAVCLLFVFFALLEFAYVNVVTRVAIRRKKDVNAGLSHVAYEFTPPEHRKEELTNSPGIKRSERVHSDSAFSRFISPQRGKARNVDRISRLVFPAIFIMFNIVYWSVYSFWKPEFEDQ